MVRKPDMENEYVKGSQSYFFNSGMHNNEEEQNIVRSQKIWRPTTLGDMDSFDMSTKKGKQAFKEYCEAQSGEVVTYNIKEQK
jgi:hypothetical protein